MERVQLAAVYVERHPRADGVRRAALPAEHCRLGAAVTQVEQGDDGVTVRLTDGETLHADLVWAYDFPTTALSPITGLVAFYNEKVDITVDGVALGRATTHFFKE